MVATLPEDDPTLNGEIDDNNHERLREIVAGHPQGAIRRIILYSVVGAAMVASIGIDGVAGIIIGTIGMISLMLLAMSDQLA